MSEETQDSQISNRNEIESQSSIINQGKVMRFAYNKRGRNQIHRTLFLIFLMSKNTEESQISINKIESQTSIINQGIGMIFAHFKSLQKGKKLEPQIYILNE